MKFKHSLSNYKLATMDMGELCVVGHFEVLPADMLSLSTSALLRVSPLLSPVMHPIQVRLHHWYVPYRLLWDGWEDFITGGQDGLGGSAGAFPYISAGGSGFTAGQLADYFGIPPGVANLEVSALPFRAYALIFNEFYRDQDLVTALGMSTGSGADSTTNTALAKIAWEKDVFTSARPWTQRGADIVLPLGTSADVVFPTGITARGTNLYNAASAGTARGNLQDQGLAGGVQNLQLTNSAGGGAEQEWLESTAVVTDAYADLSAATGVPIIDVRRAFALQRYQEKMAQFGARYTEVLRSMGVTPSDARMQRPEYLGGGKQTISFSEVLQTAEGTDAVGTMRGHGISALKSRRVKRFIEEHGIVITLASLRPRSMYADGLHKMWSRRTKEDFWQKELELIGNQEILNQEVRASHATPAGTFGYAPRYYDYRSIPNTVAAEFRTSQMYDWHLARLFGSDPTLNEAFVTCEPSKRIHAVQTNDVIWGLFNHNIKARRLVGKNMVGRVM